MNFPLKRKVRVLSIDGGGIRGLIPGLILKNISERLLSKKKKKPFSEIFDVIAGTSTGSLIALGLACPKRSNSNPEGYLKEPAYTIEDIIKIYTEKGLSIFPRGIFNNLRSVAQVFTDKYDDGSFKNILEETFKETTIRDCLTNVLVTCYNTDNSEPLIIKKRPDKKKWKSDLNFYLKDAARASSAAPTFFKPAHITTVPSNGKKYCLLDGGVFANNPAMCAYIEARKIYPNAGEYIILSLGTGRSERKFTYNDIERWGYLDWISIRKGSPITNVASNGQSKSVNHQLNKLPGVKYFRINGLLHGCSDAMDDASKKNIEDLKAVASKIIKDNNSLLDEICKLL